MVLSYHGITIIQHIAFSNFEDFLMFKQVEIIKDRWDSISKTFLEENILGRTEFDKHIRPLPYNLFLFVAIEIFFNVWL